MTAICTQLHHKYFRIFGDDTLTFLQGQFTQDISRLEENLCTYAGYCDHKANLFANLLVSGTHNDYLLRLHEGCAEAVIKRLKMFTLRAKVSIDPIEKKIFGLNRQAAIKLCKHWQQALPNSFHCIKHQQSTLSALPNDYYELTVPDETTSLGMLDITEGKKNIEILRLQGGHFNIYNETSDTIQPQQTPLAEWGIDYKKGCYVGQEVISRSKYRGKVRKTLGFAQFDCAEDIKLLTPVKLGDRAVGQVIDYYHSDENVACLALINIDTLEKPVSINTKNTQFSAIHR